MAIPAIATFISIVMAVVFDDGKPSFALQLWSVGMAGAIVVPYFKWAQRFCYGNRYDGWGRERKQWRGNHDDKP